MKVEAGGTPAPNNFARRQASRSVLCGTAGRAIMSGAPKIFGALLAQFGIAGGVLDGAMPEPILNRPRVVGQKPKKSCLRFVRPIMSALAHAEPAKRVGASHLPSRAQS
jgi:hypothetical protein